MKIECEETINSTEFSFSCYCCWFGFINLPSILPNKKQSNGKKNEKQFQIVEMNSKNVARFVRTTIFLLNEFFFHPLGPFFLQVFFLCFNFTRFSPFVSHWMQMWALRDKNFLWSQMWAFFWVNELRAISE